MKKNELRIGNWINYESYGDFEIIGLTNFGDKATYFKSLEYYPESVNIKTAKPVPLTKEWLLRMKDNENKETFPDWIKFVHEAQNWYYWNNNKKELIIKP